MNMNWIVRSYWRTSNARRLDRYAFNWKL